MSPILIRREADIDLINRIANNDAVRPFIRPDGGPMDFAPLKDMRPGQCGVVILSNGEDAIALFELTGSDEWQAHTLFGPTCRGKRAIETGKAMVAYMFARNAKLLWGRTPKENAKARYFNRQIGAVVVNSDDQDEVFEIRRPDSRATP